MGTLAEVVARLHTFRDEYPWVLGETLVDNLGKIVAKRFSYSATPVAAPLVEAAIADKMPPIREAVCSVNDRWSHFEKIIEENQSRTTDIKKARSSLIWAWVLLTLSVLIAGFFLTPAIEEGGISITISIAFGLIAAFQLCCVFYFSGEAKEARRRSEAANRKPADPEIEQKLLELETLWASHKEKVGLFREHLNGTLEKVSGVRAVMKATAYDEVVEAEKKVISAQSDVSFSRARLQNAQIKSLGVGTLEERRKAQSDYSNQLTNMRMYESTLATAEGNLRLARMRYESI